MTTKQIAVLLTDRTTDEHVGLIAFYLRGILGYSLLTDELHVFALKSIQSSLNARGLGQPLYEKYAAQLNDQKELPVEIVEREAERCAEAISQADPPLSVGLYKLAARVVTVGFERQGPTFSLHLLPRMPLSDPKTH